MIDFLGIMFLFGFVGGIIIQCNVEQINAHRRSAAQRRAMREDCRRKGL